MGCRRRLHVGGGVSYCTQAAHGPRQQTGLNPPAPKTHLLFQTPGLSGTSLDADVQSTDNRAAVGRASCMRGRHSTQ